MHIYVMQSTWSYQYTYVARLLHFLKVVKKALQYEVLMVNQYNTTSERNTEQRNGRTLSKPSRCVSIQLVYIFTSYTTINIIIHTINCYKFNGIRTLILVVLYWKMVRAWLAINFIETIPLCVNTISIYIYVIHNN